MKHDWVCAEEDTGPQKFARGSFFFAWNQWPVFSFINIHNSLEYICQIQRRDHSNSRTKLGKWYSSHSLYTRCTTHLALQCLTKCIIISPAIWVINIATTFCFYPSYLLKCNALACHKWRPALYFHVTVFIFTRFRRPHVTDIYPCKYLHTLAVVFKFTRFVWAFYPVTCGR